ncbi:hypothetical protein BIV25_32845 [Streptomyces sp. MUSC 14]|uniref:hypothetical protein n=1 Tax=Streptomyces sp. MUSC 14 TaxID=1354889 RepID=UPI0008F5F31B|nr:hypothetical protein [Streptomyces sp. MUSC 14]OIJ90087.1 hypothetical protein BIV25_32845 [Streptomyces sp. MUSC 14]
MCLRRPGGCPADAYHWRDGAGPRGKRPRTANPHWGNVEENDHYGTREFMALCEPRAPWVEYVPRARDSPMVRLRRENGRAEPWRVRFWGPGR